jgi:peptidoglycan-associated lipoprotein
MFKSLLGLLIYLVLVLKIIYNGRYFNIFHWEKKNMSIKKISVVALVILSVGLTGCANKGPKKSKHKMTHKQESSMTHGMGESTEFIERDNKAEATTQEHKAHAQNNSNDKDTYLFAFDRFDVADHDMASINAHADYLIKHPETKIYINGHTDEQGSREYNVALGERRAKAVARVLMSRGVPANQIKMVSYGAEKPAEQGNNESAYSKNRRAQTIYE